MPGWVWLPFLYCPEFCPVGPAPGFYDLLYFCFFTESSGNLLIYHCVVSSFLPRPHFWHASSCPIRDFIFHCTWHLPLAVSLLGKVLLLTSQTLKFLSSVHVIPSLDLSLTLYLLLEIIKPFFLSSSGLCVFPHSAYICRSVNFSYTSTKNLETSNLYIFKLSFPQVVFYYIRTS